MQHHGLCVIFHCYQQRFNRPFCDCDCFTFISRICSILFAQFMYFFVHFILLCIYSCCWMSDVMQVSYIAVPLPQQQQ